MWLERDIIEVGKMHLTRGEYIKNILNHPWHDSKHQPRLGRTKSILIPFKEGNFNRFEFLEESESDIVLDTVPFLEVIQSFYPTCKFIKGEIYMCPIGEEQPPHIDPKVFHRFSHRIHWPILTNSQCFLQIEDRRYHLKTNTLYEFNNMLVHRSCNYGTSNRIHLVVDVMDEKYFDALKNVDYFLKSDDPGTDVEGYLKILLS